MIERKALIFNVQKYNMYDGPGVRTMVFFKGCPLRCTWCSNPEGQLRGYQLLYQKNRCVNCGACAEVCPAGVHSMQGGVHAIVPTAECIGCRRCEPACRADALKVSGEVKTIAELLAIVEEDRPFYEMSGGGLTIGGGEVLMQPEAAASLLMACKQRNIHTAIETCGYARPEVFSKVAPYIDIFLYDIKHMDSTRHYELTGVRNETILTNLRWLFENQHAVQIRVPLLKGHNDTAENLAMMVDFLRPYQHHQNFKGIDLLPYHKMGVNKYAQLGWEYPVQGDPKLDDADCDRVAAALAVLNVPVTVIKH